MRIRSNEAALRGAHSSELWAERIERNSRQIASGVRIASGRDDAAGLVISQKLRAHLGGLRQTVQNLQNIVGVYDVIDQTQQSVVDIARRMRELAVRAQNSATVSTEEIAALQAEFHSLVVDAGRISDMTRLGDRALSIGAGGTYYGANARIQLSEQAGDYLDPLPNGSLNDLAGNIRGISVTVDDPTAIGVIDAAVQDFQQNVRAAYVATRFRADAALTVAQNRLAALGDAESRITGADMASASTERVKAGILLSAGVAMTAQAAKLSSSVVGLLWQS
jgi:flagellin